MNARLNILCLAAAALILSLAHEDRPWIVVSLIGCVIAVAILFLPRAPRRTPTTITRLPTEHERQSGGSRWLYGLFIRIPILSFLSVGLFRWRGRK